MSYGNMTVGVEEEFLLVDEHGRLNADGPEVSEAAAGVDEELLRCQVETATDVCADRERVSANLAALRADVATAAARRGLRVLPSGTAPIGYDPVPVTEQPRYRRMEHEFGAVVRAVLTSACHVHVAVPDRAGALVVANAVRPWLPVLLALTANSPFHDGADTRYASWRHMMWSRWPSAGPPPHLRDAEEYESLVDTLLRTGGIMDRGMLYWDVRPSEHAPTVEFRAADVLPTVREAALLAALLRGIAALALDRGALPGEPVPQEVLRAQSWRAAREGLGGLCPRPGDARPVPAWQVLDSLLTEIERPLREQDDLDFVRETLAWLREVGCGAHRQRAAFGRRDLLTDVVDEFVLTTG